MQTNERLTHRRANGIKEGYWTNHKKDEVVQRLGEYEDTELSPEEIRHVKGPKHEKVDSTEFEPFLEEVKESLKGYEGNCVKPPGYTSKLCFLSEILTVTAGNPVELSFTAGQIKQVLSLAK